MCAYLDGLHNILHSERNQVVRALHRLISPQREALWTTSTLCRVSHLKGDTPVASIDQRQGPDGKLVYRVRVRRKGTPPQTATFTKFADAKRWTQMTEGHVIEDLHFPSTKPTRHTVSETIERYLHEILPHMSTNTRYNQRYQLQ